MVGLNNPDIGQVTEARRKKGISQAISRIAMSHRLSDNASGKRPLRRAAFQEQPIVRRNRPEHQSAFGIDLAKRLRSPCNVHKLIGQCFHLRCSERNRLLGKNHQGFRGVDGHRMIVLASRDLHLT